MPVFAEVHRYIELPLAEIARAKLESEDIYCYLQNKYHIGLKWQLANALGGVRLLVRFEDRDRAKEILEKDESHLLNEISFPDPEISDLCRICSSENIEVIFLRRYSGALMMLTGLPLIFWGTYYKCKDCGYKNKK